MDHKDKANAYRYNWHLCMFGHIVKRQIFKKFGVWKAQIVFSRGCVVTLSGRNWDHALLLAQLTSGGQLNNAIAASIGHQVVYS